MSATKILAIVVAGGFTSLLLLALVNVVPDRVGPPLCFVWAWLAFALAIVVLVT
jgi:uncharacterized membrane protein